MKINKIEADYVDLTKKLGKLPSKREFSKLKNHRPDQFSKFVAEMVSKYPDLPQIEVPARLTDQDIENYRLSKFKSQIKSSNQSTIKSNSDLDYLEATLSRIIPAIKPVKPLVTNSKTKRVLNIVFSDVHVGADLSKSETGVADYGTVEESRRVAAVVKEVINYKPQYRKETELEVLLLGDLIQNQLHDPRDGAALAEQKARALYIFSQAIQQFASNFKNVNVRCQSGNHGRSTARHHDRAVNQKWDSNETDIYYALKIALRDQKNVTFHIPKTPYGVYEVFGEKVLYTHGDTFLNPGYPGKSINIKGLETQINTINASLEDKNEIKCAIVGHVHTASQTYLSNGCIMITNGALISPDQYAVSIGVLETHTGQMLFESYPGFAVGDTRYIRVGYKADQDTSLDKVIKPWTNF